jgi:hypothetical protein
MLSIQAKEEEPPSKTIGHPCVSLEYILPGESSQSKFVSEASLVPPGPLPILRVFEAWW